MARAPMTQIITEAQRESFPEISALMKRSVAEAMDDAGVSAEAFDRVEAYLATDSASRKRVVQETIWALSRMGKLRTPEDAAVIDAAKGLVKAWGNPDPELQITPIEDRLDDAVVALPDFGWNANETRKPDSAR